MMGRRHLAVLAAILVLGACSDEGVNPVFDAAVDELNPFDREEAAATPQGPPVTRAAVNRADVAMIRARLEGDVSPTYLQATSRNGPYVTYVSSLRQSLTLVGSQVTGTRGLGFDLLSATSSQPDPLNRPIPLSSWPSGVTRSYEFPANGPQGRIETYACRFERGSAREITILDERHSGIEISEYCEGPTGSFENLHLADASSGRVWRSLQWTGPRQGLIDIEIVLPYTGTTD
jgi:Group 4 capsule polysaccharide lipoprotein gfcB, YjbF